MYLIHEATIKHPSGLIEITVHIVNEKTRKRYDYVLTSLAITERFHRLYRKGKEFHGRALALLNKFKAKEEGRKKMRIENWSVVIENYSPYLAPELYRQSLHGKVFGHPRFQDGEFVTTSSIVGRKGDLVVTRSGSEYELGDVDPEYEEIYPGTKARLLNSLKEE